MASSSLPEPTTFILPNEPGTIPLTVIEVYPPDEEPPLDPQQYLKWYAQAVTDKVLDKYTSGLGPYLEKHPASKEVTNTAVAVVYRGGTYWIPFVDSQMEPLVEKIYSCFQESGLAELRNALHEKSEEIQRQLEDTLKYSRNLRFSLGYAGKTIPKYLTAKEAVPDAYEDIASLLESRRDAYSQALSAFDRALSKVRLRQAQFLRDFEVELFGIWGSLLQDNANAIKHETGRYDLQTQISSKEPDSGGSQKSGQESTRWNTTSVKQVQSLATEKLESLRKLQGAEATKELRAGLSALAEKREALKDRKFWALMFPTPFTISSGSSFLYPIPYAIPIGSKFYYITKNDSDVYINQLQEECLALQELIRTSFPVAIQLFDKVDWDAKTRDLSESNEQLLKLIHEALANAQDASTKLASSKRLLAAWNKAFAPYRWSLMKRTGAPYPEVYHSIHAQRSDFVVTHMEYMQIYSSLPSDEQMDDVSPPRQLAFVVMTNDSPTPWTQFLALAKTAEAMNIQPGSLEFQTYNDYLRSLEEEMGKQASKKQQVALLLSVSALILAPFTDGGSLVALALFTAWQAGQHGLDYLSVAQISRGVLTEDLSPLIRNPSLARVVWELVDAGIDLVPALGIVGKLSPIITRAQALGNAVDFFSSLEEE